MRDVETARVGEVAALLGLSQKWAMRCLPSSSAMWKCLSGGIPVLDGCLMQLLDACKPEPASAGACLAKAMVHLQRSANVQYCCAWLPGKQSRTVKRPVAAKFHHQSSLASTARMISRAAVSCCL